MEPRKMPTRDYRETLRERAQVDAEFRKEMLKGAVRCMFNGEPKIGRLLLYDCVYATIGFDELSKKTGKQRESLEHMLSRDGDPSAGDLFGIVDTIAENESVMLEVLVKRRHHAEELVAA